MKTQNFKIKTKKVGAGQFEVNVTDLLNNEIKNYIENDMTLYDAFTEEDGMYDITQSDAMEILILKSGF